MTVSQVNNFPHRYTAPSTYLATATRGTYAWPVAVAMCGRLAFDLPYGGERYIAGARLGLPDPEVRTHRTPRSS